MNKARILVVDDEMSPRESLRFILKDQYEVVTCEDGASALAHLRSAPAFDLVLADIMMPGMSGLELLAQIMSFAPSLPVVMVTAVAEAKPAVQAMKLGAMDYINKPFDVEEIRLVVERVLKEKSLEREVGRLRAYLESTRKFDQIVGEGAAMQEVYRLMQKVVDTDCTVLVLGETGTGKELVARALHYSSSRKDGPFIPVHCAAIPGELLESELFGHEKGAFTGALQRRIGMFEAADGGTLFLDEIGEMPMGTQSKLLRAIQEREVRRVGSQETVRINVRLVCATNRDLETEVKKGNFREDLFYRINVVPLVLPSLRDRQEDILPLVLHFSERFARQMNRAAPTYTPAAIEMLRQYPWPGNVRELQHTIERLMVTCDATEITPEHLPFMVPRPAQPDRDSAAIAKQTPVPETRADLGEAMEIELTADSTPRIRIQPGSDGFDLSELTNEVERISIQQALQRSDGVITEAARFLRITRRMLRYKMDRLGIPTGESDTPASQPDPQPLEEQPVPS
jgi:two-component system response regulator PilR (NtrC family)